LIARFLIGVGAVILLAVGVRFWRTRASADDASDSETE
jgi:hypothetical protein